MKTSLILLVLAIGSVATGCSRSAESNASAEAVTESRVTREWAGRLKTNFDTVAQSHDPLLREARKVTVLERQSPEWNQKISVQTASMLSSIDVAIASLKLVTDDEVTFRRGTPLVVSLGDVGDDVSAKTVWGVQNGATALRAQIVGSLAEAIARLGVGDNAAQDKAYDDVEAVADKLTDAANALTTVVSGWLGGDAGTGTGTQAADSRCGTVRPGEWCNAALAPTLVWRVGQSAETNFDDSKKTVCSALGSDFRFPTQGELSAAFKDLQGNPSLAGLSKRIHYLYGPGNEGYGSFLSLGSDGTTTYTDAGAPQSIACVREPKVPRASLAVTDAPAVCGTVRIGEFCDGLTAPTLVFRTAQSYDVNFDDSKKTACTDLGPGYRFPSQSELSEVLAKLLTSTKIAKLSRRVHYLYGAGNEGYGSFMSLNTSNVAYTDAGGVQSIVCVRSPE